MKNEAFAILIDGGIITEDVLFKALWDGSTIGLHGPWEGSDYSGDDLNESNQRSLARDYPDLLRGYSRSFGHCEYGLEIDPREFGKWANREAAVDLAKLLSGLKNDWPVYDEQDNSALIQERAEEAWGNYLRMDLTREVGDQLGAGVCLDDLEEKFWELLSDHEIWPEAEGHRDVIFPGIRDEPFIRDLAKAAIEDGGLDPWTIRELTDTGYAIVGEWMAQDFRVPDNQLALF
ncbi:hypothetical protein Ssi03_13150 [Sphaerisporangium siamense]|uniref:Uncharacterized protein n=1 Tax=Sphaerisporangium siamense TaxID=795645 RepID=A0A7W7DAA8_9ACTN|nr:hypothetical protein [Sphaerisporangium siamense]MBB4702916.1 hypothetical protein [Sphaerisporangium siamense]GII83325.1 hypothetical protein Ssi03_13150 [Sphaerisporangium siamense]